ncbi:LOW QUALITY PROTEIN: receptor-type tyrosine-protein phosphatase epsilon-like [Pelodytes ibericus]
MNVSAEREYNHSFTGEEAHWFPPNVTEFILQFKYGTNYTIQLRGFTLAGAGEYTEWRYQTPISDPPTALQQTISVGVRTAEMQLHPVPDLHGPISDYEIIIFMGQRKNLSGVCLGYSSTHYNSSTAPYTAALLPAHNITEPVTLSLGDGKHYSGFLNAPLRPGYNYTVYVRVTSRWKEVQATIPFISDIFRPPQQYAGSGCRIGGCILRAAGFSGSGDPQESWIFQMKKLNECSVKMLYFMYLSLNRSRSLRCTSFKTSSIPLRRQDGPGKKKDVPVEDLLRVVKDFRKMEVMTMEESEAEENSNMLPVGRFKEYKELPSGLLYPCEAATLEQNIPKNRYKKVIPYDESRVRLQSNGSGSDYINASYIDGYKNSKFYIATQGPLPGTVADFWQMVWQENCPVIIMLTGLEEQNKVKCERYWPEQSDTYGDITVSVQRSMQTGAITTRSFLMKKVSTLGGGGGSRTVEHLHYLEWSDHGVPSKLSGLLQLVEQMNKSKVPGSGPILVHCSAGIGRTGTLIALDILLKMARAVRKVNVYNCILQLRKKRVSMVQNKEQYVFLYDTLLETLLCGVTSVSVLKIQKCVQSLAAFDPITNVTGYTKEFQDVQKLTGLYQLCSFKEGEKPDNKSKNRDPTILPADHCRPILMSTSGRESASGYINAVFVNSNAQADIFLVTQLPMKQTLSDFWALVWDYKCTSVVLMQHPQDVAEMSGHFWPERGEGRYDNYSVKMISKAEQTGYNETTLCLKHGQESVPSSMEVKLWQLTCWPKDSPVPNNPAAFVSLLEVTEKRQQMMSDGHVLVMCHDGASQSGLFCAGAIVCDQIRSDGCLDVSQAVRALKKRRSQLIPSVIQYAFCYTLAQSYLDSFETYGNFK